MLKCDGSSAFTGRSTHAHWPGSRPAPFCPAAAGAFWKAMRKAPVTERVNDERPPERHLMGYVCAFADEAKNSTAKAPSPKRARRAVWRLHIARFLPLDVCSAG